MAYEIQTTMSYMVVKAQVLAQKVRKKKEGTPQGVIQCIWYV